MARQAHHVIVRTKSGYHDRLVAANGNPIDATKVYPDPRQARRAIAISIEAALAMLDVDPTTLGAETSHELAKAAASSVSIVDERTTG